MKLHTITELGGSDTLARVLAVCFLEVREGVTPLRREAVGSSTGNSRISLSPLAARLVMPIQHFVSSLNQLIRG